MAINLQIIHANDFIKTTPEGEVNLELCAQNRGVQLAAFTEYEEAANWLSAATELKL